MNLRTLTSDLALLIAPVFAMYWIIEIKMLREGLIRG